MSSRDQWTYILIIRDDMNIVDTIVYTRNVNLHIKDCVIVTLSMRCPHGLWMIHCDVCNAGPICIHSYIKSICTICIHTERCEHNRRKMRCTICLKK